jgi:hypothetical protein
VNAASSKGELKKMELLSRNLYLTQLTHRRGMGHEKAAIESLIP